MGAYLLLAGKYQLKWSLKPLKGFFPFQLKQLKEMLITIFNEFDVCLYVFFLSCRIIQQRLCYQMRQKGLHQNKSLSIIQLPFLKSECYICFPVKFVNVDGNCTYRDQWQPFNPETTSYTLNMQKRFPLQRTCWSVPIELEENQNKNKDEETTTKSFRSNPM